MQGAWPIRWPLPLRPYVVVVPGGTGVAAGGGCEPVAAVVVVVVGIHVLLETLARSGTWNRLTEALALHLHPALENTQIDRLLLEDEMQILLLLLRQKRRMMRRRRLYCRDLGLMMTPIEAVKMASFPVMD